MTYEHIFLRFGGDGERRTRRTVGGGGFVGGWRRKFGRSWFSAAQNTLVPCIFRRGTKPIFNVAKPDFRVTKPQNRGPKPQEHGTKRDFCSFWSNLLKKLWYVPHFFRGVKKTQLVHHKKRIRSSILAGRGRSRDRFYYDRFRGKTRVLCG